MSRPTRNRIALRAEALGILACPEVIEKAKSIVSGLREKHTIAKLYPDNGGGIYYFTVTPFALNFILLREIAEEMRIDVKQVKNNTFMYDEMLEMQIVLYSAEDIETAARRALLRKAGFYNVPPYHVDKKKTT